MTTGRVPRLYRGFLSSVRRRFRDRGGRGRAAEHLHTRTAADFRAACENGDLAGLVCLLDPDATVLSDDGGRFRAPRGQVRGAERTARFLIGVLAQFPRREALLGSVNGRTGLLLRQGGTVVGVVSFDVRSGRITEVWLMLNPDKLRSWNRS
ncbi:sigma-70 family RNA polymerase sigma factor family protein [Peterkaempfera griseoplana]|uniref:hypothetical protein n=1 Tax=Peterkaempfera griseoplana TaxID=66896 RepID=UPI0006E46ED6|nr:hypothetical protein [Peterkaempfera griseoplana]